MTTATVHELQLQPARLRAQLQQLWHRTTEARGTPSYQPRFRAWCHAAKALLHLDSLAMARVMEHEV